MFKKHLILVMLLVLAAVGANAGTWKMHNYYVEKKVQNIFDAVGILNPVHNIEILLGNSFTIRDPSPI